MTLAHASFARHEPATDRNRQRIVARQADIGLRKLEASRVKIYLVAE